MKLRRAKTYLMMMFPGAARAYTTAKADRTVLVRGTRIMEKFTAAAMGKPGPPKNRGAWEHSATKSCRVLEGGMIISAERLEGLQGASPQSGIGWWGRLSNVMETVLNKVFLPGGKHILGQGEYSSTPGTAVRGSKLCCYPGTQSVIMSHILEGGL